MSMDVEQTQGPKMERGKWKGRLQSAVPVCPSVELFCSEKQFGPSGRKHVKQAPKEGSHEN